jgi:hypothetical protein
VFHSGMVDSAFLGYDAALLGRFSTFRWNRLPSDLASYPRRTASSVLLVWPARHMRLLVWNQSEIVCEVISASLMPTFFVLCSFHFLLHFHFIMLTNLSIP